MYKIFLTQRALKDLERIGSKTQNRIATKLRELAQEPIQQARKLTNPEMGTYRFRIRDYRVIFDLDGEKIIILRIGHRKNIYK